ncbi:fluoride efflux transporter CrcB [Halostella salina]|uniref:fluoride efflux transporter CrcB n=1 Tax=Halostella salina TaxID=1547897 RepID=UPI000EF83F49|nr:fluoride efflux transporter CrcB [Halostella salina]
MTKTASLASGVSPAYLVGVGGVLGAVARHLVYVGLKDGDDVPRATLAVNVVGSFALGALTAAGVGESAALLLGTGACGAFTTFSSFSVETVQLWDAGNRRAAAANAVLNLTCSLAAVALGWLVAA